MRHLWITAQGCKCTCSRAGPLSRSLRSVPTGTPRANPRPFSLGTTPEANVPFSGTKMNPRARLVPQSHAHPSVFQLADGDSGSEADVCWQAGAGCWRGHDALRGRHLRSGYLPLCATTTSPLFLRGHCSSVRGLMRRYAQYCYGDRRPSSRYFCLLLFVYDT